MVCWKVGRTSFYQEIGHHELIVQGDNAKLWISGGIVGGHTVVKAYNGRCCLNRETMTMIKNCAVIAALTAWSFSASAESQKAGSTMDTAGPGKTAPIQETTDVDLEQAQKTFNRSCRACHGNKAQGVASYPKLSDKDPEYIAEKLKVYRSGERIGPNSVLMIQNAKDLSDQDIAGLAVYVATAFE